MEDYVVRRARRSDAQSFLVLLTALADFERLEPPDEAAKRRIVSDIFARRRLGVFVAEVGGKLVGYALYFYSYSSFLGRATLYLEDIFVTEDYRRKGIGGALFRRCAREAISNRCGRMEWAVLTWNRKAIDFYKKVEARRLDDWFVYRLSSDQLANAAREVRGKGA
jgi:GNAT superfamily N-acetyltransferase